MSHRPFVITVLLVVALIVYLFVSAPPPLTANSAPAATIPTERVLALAEGENDVVRELWTKEIVQAGKKVGLAFDEDWRERGVEAGPLPALFLRETAASLEKNPVRLSLYLGSDFPVNDANRFRGIQAEMFHAIKEHREPQFAYNQDTQLYTAMFSDLAVAAACVTCHNDHPQSPKNDWRLGDVMGATTWTYPTAAVDVDELLSILAALRRGFSDAYSAYLEKTASFTRRPEIGELWPRDGYYLPAVDVFMAEAVRRSSPQTLTAILHATENAGEEQ